MTLTLDLLVGAVKAGLTGWKLIKGAAEKGAITVHNAHGDVMLLAELETHILSAEDAAKATGQQAHDRIEQRHEGEPK
jgi:hypothetical protein